MSVLLSDYGNECGINLEELLYICISGANVTDFFIDILIC
jgi:hypothetical protein